MLFRSVVVAVGLSLLVAPGPAFGDEMVAIGKKSNRCLPGPGADCSKVVHKWRLEAHGNLKGVNFQDAKIPGADFRGAQLQDANFMGADLRSSDFDGADFSGAKFGGANLDFMQANGSTAVGVDFSQSAGTRSKRQTLAVDTFGEPNGCGWSPSFNLDHLTALDFDASGTQWDDYSLGDWTVTGSKFANSNFYGVLVTNGDWAHTTWSGADLSCAKSRWGANLFSADFSGATFASTDLSDAFLCDTKMPDGTIRDDSC